jgi:hypothetical protein
MSGLGVESVGGYMARHRDRKDTMFRWATLLFAVVGASGCRSASSPPPRYIVTVTPFPFLGGRHPGFCVAVDPNDSQGVWWWEPGRSGCRSRSTGPAVFPAGAARVARSSSGIIEASFEIQLMINPPRQVRLEVHEDHMRAMPSGPLVSAERLATLDFPAQPPPIAARDR